MVDPVVKVEFWPGTVRFVFEEDTTLTVSFSIWMLASSKRLVSQAAAKNSVRKNKNSTARGSKITPVGKLNKRLFRYTL